MKIDLLELLLQMNNISREEFEEMILQMKNNQVNFITGEINPNIGKKKNIVKSIFQSIYPYQPCNYIIDKPVVDHICLVVLGTAAGGYAVSQRDRTGGIILHSGDKRIHIDTGPTAVKDCEDYSICTGENWDPILTDALVLTHNHIDHCGGAEEYVETWMPFSGMFEKTIIANKTIVEGNPRFEQGPRFDKYKKAKVGTVQALRPGDSKKLGEITIKATKAIHIEAYDPITGEKGGDCLGFVIETPYGTIGITGDTEYHDSMIDDFHGIDYLSAYIVQERSRSQGAPERYNDSDVGLGNQNFHMQFLGELGVEKILNEIKPKCCLLTHYGDQFATFIDGRLSYKEIPRVIAKRIENNTRVRTIACLNGMKLDIEKDIKIKVNEKYFLSSNRLSRVVMDK